MQYDTQERLKMVANAGDSPTYYHYASNGLVDTVSGATTQKEVRQFDGVGHVTHVDYGGGVFVNYYYDPATQRLQTSIDNASHTTSYSYTADGNSYQHVASGGRVTTRTVDTHGRQFTSQTSSMNVFTTYYDSLNRPVALYNGTGASPVRFTYDALFRTDVQDPNGNVTHTDYNALGWPTQVRDPLTHVSTYRYDASGMLTSMTNRRNQRVNYTYDNAARLTAKSGDNTTSDSFSYGPGNQSMVAWNSLETDSVRLWPGASGGTTGAGPLDSTVTWLAGQRYRVLHGNGQSWANADSMTITANTGVTFRSRHLTTNTLTGEINTVPDGFNTTTYAYNGEQLRYSTGTTSGITGTRSENYTSLHGVYATDFSSSFLSLAHGRAYHYDVANRIDQVLRNGWPTFPVSTFGYDGLGRVAVANQYTCNDYTFDSTAGRSATGCSLTASAGYTYDAAGNRTDQGGTYTTGNRLQHFGVYNFEYDFDGNVTRKYNTSTLENRYFSWSAEGRLTDVVEEAQSVHYDYNAFGQPVRTKKNSVVDRYWLYDGDDLLAEFDATASNQRAAEYLYSPGVDVPYATIIGATSPTQIWYHQQDQLGNAIGLQANANPNGSFSYDTWGKLTGGTVLASNRLTWKGRMWDGGIVGLYYMRNRWYDPEIGRFMSEDPAGMVDGPNLYLFANNDPVNGSDPYGLHSVGDITTEAEAEATVDSFFGDLINGKIHALFHHHKHRTPAVAKRKGPASGAIESAGWGDPLFLLSAVFTGGETAEAEEAFSAIGSTGKVGEVALKDLGGESQAYFGTSQGGRYVDQLVEKVANESKVGYQSLTPRIALQISKDAELMGTGAVDDVVWHFFRSPITGKMGPSQPLFEALLRNGIKVIKH
jgi:RHS repeat-associated protein